MANDFEEFTSDLEAIGIEGMRDASEIAARVKKRWLAIAQERAPVPVTDIPGGLEVLAQCFAIELVRAAKLSGVPTELEGSSTAVEGKVSNEYCVECDCSTYHLDGVCEHTH